MGYRFKDSGCRLSHAKFADDVSVIDFRCTMNHEIFKVGIQNSHDWVCEFFGAHGWNLKAAKSAFATTCDPALVKPLQGMSGTAGDCITPRGRNAADRYLGCSKRCLHVIGRDRLRLMIVG